MASRVAAEQGGCHPSLLDKPHRLRSVDVIGVRMGTSDTKKGNVVIRVVEGQAQHFEPRHLRVFLDISGGA